MRGSDKTVICHPDRYCHPKPCSELVLEFQNERNYEMLKQVQHDSLGGQNGTVGIQHDKQSVHWLVVVTLNLFQGLLHVMLSLFRNFRIDSTTRCRNKFGMTVKRV